MGQKIGNFWHGLVVLSMFFAMAPSIAGENVKVQFETSKGNIMIELFSDKAPKSVENFLHYVDSGHYDGLIFHRVIPGFMIQGGGFEPGMRERQPENDPIPNEADNGLLNKRGSLAMARTADPHSASAQFYINVADNDFLNHSSKTPQGWGYAVFGQVSAGMEVADAIVATPTGQSGAHGDVPVEDIIIVSARRLGQQGEKAPE